MGRIIASGALVAVALLCSCGETVESQYANRVEADRDGAMYRGWIPDWLPDSATEIREIHIIDTDETWLAFAALEPDLQALTTECVAMPEAPKGFPRQIRSWWPGELSSGGQRPLDSYQFLACQNDGAAYLAIDHKNVRAYYWYTHRELEAPDN